MLTHHQREVYYQRKAHSAAAGAGAVPMVGLLISFFGHGSKGTDSVSLRETIGSRTGGYLHVSQENCWYVAALDPRVEN